MRFRYVYSSFKNVFGNARYGRMLSDVIGCFILGQGSGLTGPQKSTTFLNAIHLLLHFMMRIDLITIIVLLTGSLDLYLSRGVEVIFECDNRTTLC